MPTLDPHIFRAYDIRGQVGDQINATACELIGKAFGSALRDLYQVEYPRVVVGRDARTHGPELEAALVQGLTSTGCHVQLIGQTPSPINYFTICHDDLDAGVQITASHNPAGDNGLKLQIRDAEAYSGEYLQQLHRRIETDDFLVGEGSIANIDAIEPYVTYITNLFDSCGQNLHIVVDCGNGVAGPVYCNILRQIGCTVTELYTEPDGTFPNHPADPSKWETLAELQNKVKEVGAHLGVAYDGDGDRIGIVDENGVIKTADDILLLLARDHLHRHPGKPVIFTVSNSGTLQTEIEKWGGQPIMCTVGHSFVEHAMTEHEALLGGEQSGHFFCGEDYFGFDDALVATLRVLRIASQSDQSFSSLFADFPPVFQAPEHRPHCPDDKKVAVIEAITKHYQDEGYPVNTLDGARIDFGDGAWAGIRKSNTSPCISVCIEARSEEKLAEVKNNVMSVLAQFPEIGE